MHPSEEPTLDWNLQELLERVDDDREFMRELLMIFRGDSLATMKKKRRTGRTLTGCAHPEAEVEKFRDGCERGYRGRT